VIAPVRRLKERDAVLAEVQKQSISVEMRAIPPKLNKGVIRRTRQSLGIIDKGIPEDRLDEFNERYYVELAVDLIVRWRDNRTGQESFKMNAEQITTLVDFLPTSESNRFIRTIDDLQGRTAISEAAVAQADF